MVALSALRRVRPYRWRPQSPNTATCGFIPVSAAGATWRQALALMTVTQHGGTSSPAPMAANGIEDTAKAGRWKRVGRMAQHYLTGIPWNCVRVLNGWEVSEIISTPRDAVDPPDVLVRAFWMPPTLDVDIITHLEAMVDCLEDLAQQKPCPPYVERMDPEFADTWESLCGIFTQEDIIPLADFRDLLYELGIICLQDLACMADNSMAGHPIYR